MLFTIRIEPEAYEDIQEGGLLDHYIESDCSMCTHKGIYLFAKGDPPSHPHSKT